MSKLQVGDIVHHKDHRELVFRVIDVQLVDDDSPDSDVQGLDLESLRTRYQYEVHGDSFDTDVFLKLEGKHTEIETNSWSIEKKQIERCHEMAGGWLKNHVLDHQCKDPENRVSYYRFRDPSSNHYWFDVIAFPTGFTIHGDMGTYTFRNRLTWAKSAIRDVSYFASKVVSESETKSWDKDVAHSYVWGEYFWRAEELIFEGGEVGEKLQQLNEVRQDLLEKIDDGENSFNYYLYHETDWADGCDFPDNKTFNWSLLACREALLKAFELMETKTN